MKWLSGLAALVGAWIILSPFLFESTVAAGWNNLLVGAAILLISGFNFYRLSNGKPSVDGAMGIVALLGIWTLITPFAIDIGSDALLWSNVIAGVLVVLHAGAVATVGRRIRAEAPEATD